MVSEHQLSPVIDAFHTTPTTHVNQSPKLLKLIGWRHCRCFRWVPYIPGTTAQMPDAELGPTARSSVTVLTVSLWNSKLTVILWNNKHMGCQSSPGTL